MTKRKPFSDEEPIAKRASDYCRTGEAAAFYLDGVADAIELLGTDDRHKGLVHRLRHHSHELRFGTMWVEHGYKEGK